MTLFASTCSGLRPHADHPGTARPRPADMSSLPATARAADVALSNDEQQRLQAATVRRSRALDRRELLAETLVGGGFVAASAALIAVGRGAGSPHWATLALVTVCFAVLARVRFDVGTGFTVPTQLLFVPMLFLLPATVVPAAVAGGFVLSGLPEVLRRRQPAARLALRLGDSWFSVGPALLLALHGGGIAKVDDWWLYLAALAAQVSGDFVSAWVRDAIHGEAAPLREQLHEARWIYTVDVMLSAIGLLAAFAAAGRPALVVLVLPLAALLSMFATERRSRIDHVIELSQAYRGTALVLGDVVEADDAYTGDHTKGVVALAIEVAEEMGLDARGRQRVEFGALLHDVGKIAIPKSIINKPGPLDDDEWALIRTHTVEGQRLLDRVGGLMRDVGLVVRASHERWDGGGYPDGLVGEAIPIEARIVSCCDAYNAMTTTRSYRTAMSAEAALAECFACAGTQFDPAVVAALARVVGTQPAADAPGA
jgi:HD-GYP domain-containing protein (c-di-GMP phosphodiesterase class II)